MKRYLSILILAMLIIPIIPITAIPTVVAQQQAQQQVVIKTSRDEWGNVWKNQVFYIDVEVSPPPDEENITLIVVIAGEPYEVNATRVVKGLHRAWLYVDMDDKLYDLGSNGEKPKKEPKDVTDNDVIATLEEGDVISFRYGGVSKSLKYTHIAPELSIRSPIPQEVEMVGIKDWIIKAPDLNSDPRSREVTEANITIKDYTADVILNFTNVNITETDDNSGKFRVEESYIVTELSKGETGIDVSKSAVLELTDAPEPKDAKVRIWLNITFSEVDTGNVTTIEILKDSWIVIYGNNISLKETTETKENISNGKPTTIILEPEGFYRIEFNITITRTDTGTKYDVTVDQFNVTAVPEYLYALAKRLRPEALKPGNVVDVWANVSQYQGADKVDTTAPQGLEIEVYYGTITAKATLKDGLTITIEDKGRNYRSYVKDKVEVEVAIGTCKDTEIYTLYETDKNTGIFKLRKAISLAKYYATGCLSNITRNITITYTDSAGIKRNRTIEVEYFTGKIVEVSPSQVVPGVTRLVVKIEDADLNLDPKVRDYYREPLEKDDEVFLNLSSADFDISLGMVRVYAIIDDRNYSAKVKTAFTIVAVEEGLDSSIFTVMINLSNVNLTVAKGKLKAVRIVYIDYFTPTKKVEKSKKDLPIVEVSIDVKEDSVPINAHYPVAVHIEVIDPSANKNPGIEETINVIYRIYNVSKKVVGGGNVELTETGRNTGSFAGAVNISLELLKPDIINGYIVFIYSSETGKVVNDTVAIKLYPADIEVNATRVKYGDWLEIRVIDKEFDLNQTAINNFTAAELRVFGVPPGLRFNETGPNTGEFVAVIQVNKTLGDPGSWITIKHKDPRPIYATPEMGDWPEAYEAVTRVYIESFDGEISTDKTEYGPAATITIIVKDPDHNFRPDERDDVTVKYLNPVRRRWYTIVLNETGPNTGVFNASLPIPKLGEAAEVIGKTIRFIYEDRWDANGKENVFETRVKVVSWTAEIKTDKKSYVLGEKIRITITDPDANPDPNAVDDIEVHVYTDTDPAGTYIRLYETDVNTGVFVGEVLISSAPGPGSVMAREIDTVYIVYEDEYPEGYPKVADLPITLEVSVGKVVPRPIEVPKIVAVDPKTGEEVEKFKVDTLAGLKITLKNVATKTKRVAVIAVIYDPNDVTTAIQAFMLPIAGEESADLLLSFTPRMVGNYTVKIYVVKGLTLAERAQTLSPEPVYTFTVTVVE